MKNKFKITLCEAAQDGHMDAVQYLVERKIWESSYNYKHKLALLFRDYPLNVPENRMKYIEAHNEVRNNLDDYNEAFCLAAAGGYKEIMQYLIEQLPKLPVRKNVLELITYKECFAFRSAAAGGYRPVMEYLVALAPTKVQYMLESAGMPVSKDPDDGYIYIPNCGEGYSYQALSWAAEGGRQDAVEYLVELASTQAKQMIAYNDYQVFRYAAAKGHLNVMKYLTELAPVNVLIQSALKRKPFNHYANDCKPDDYEDFLRCVQLHQQRRSNLINPNHDDLGLFGYVLVKHAQRHDADEIERRDNNYKFFKKHEHDSTDSTIAPSDERMDGDSFTADADREEGHQDSCNLM